MEAKAEIKCIAVVLQYYFKIYPQKLSFTALLIKLCPKFEELHVVILVLNTMIAVE
jgi:hypothetical protein